MEQAPTASEGEFAIYKRIHAAAGATLNPLKANTSVTATGDNPVTHIAKGHKQSKSLQITKDAPSSSRKLNLQVSTCKRWGLGCASPTVFAGDRRLAWLHNIFVHRKV